ncbi:2-dehydro-3-deoxygalactonokinase [Thalassobacillus sp. CUG 92003]|uniref:2-dehydro-3-deoxygalactonokinase n=1 Tax=Thalassobacillus sp. CUG 92003 TaxID=2736641 RepID=UPI0015E70170|nr:2-dehydro-3-deoxygalactonokinase [Thalassobacillus sp. CUG 92003]
MKAVLIDSGTTNSRLRLVDAKTRHVNDVLKLEVGVRNAAMDQNTDRLTEELQSGLKDLLERNGLAVSELAYIVASGMITSNLGLLEVPHISAPAASEDFVRHTQQIKLDAFFNIPCLFVPGMKTVSERDIASDISVIDDYDVMRGEEVEGLGLLHQLEPQGEGMLVLPGSHTKYVQVREDKSFTSCLSTLAGEMLKAVRNQTIIADSLDGHLISAIDQERLIEGYEAAKRVGITRAFYHIRLLHLFSQLDANARANYYAGVVLYYDLEALMNKTSQGRMEWIIVGGSDPLRSAFVHLLNHANKGWRIIEADDHQVEMASVHGACDIGNHFLANEE